MTKIRLLTIAVGALLLLNAVVISLVFTRPNDTGPMGPPPRGGPPLNGREANRPRNIIIDRLQFDQDQITAYNELILDHAQAIKVLQADISEAKQQLYMRLGESDPQADSTQWAHIQTLLLSIEETHYRHFADIKGLCRPDQLPAFEKLSADLARLFWARKLPPR